MTTMKVRLQGRVIFDFTIQTKTGLHIGAQQTGVEIGDIDLPILRDPITRTPIVPGSSLKGKMRSLTEKASGAVQNTPVGQAMIHTCLDKQILNRNAYRQCTVCPVFGIPAPSVAKEGEEMLVTLTRLAVYDAFLTPESVARLDSAGLDIPYAEAKTEVAIDRITARAVPRTQERVPAGTEFKGTMVYSVFDERDYGLLQVVLQALSFIEDDYLGGQGSRGSGQVTFRNLRLSARAVERYQDSVRLHLKDDGYESVAEVLADATIDSPLRSAIPFKAA